MYHNQKQYNCGSNYLSIIQQYLKTLLALSITYFGLRPLVYFGSLEKSLQNFGYQSFLIYSILPKN